MSLIDFNWKKVLEYNGEIIIAESIEDIK